MSAGPRRVVIACGGTGGHLFPGVAVGRELRARGHAVHLIVSRKEIDAVALRGEDGFETTAQAAVGWRGVSGALTFARAFLRARRECRELFSRWKPDVVLGMGGFTCAAPLMSARSMGIPAWLHESNAIPGKVTRFLAPRVSGVMLGLEACARHLPSVRTRVTGTPVRMDVARGGSAAEARARLGLDASCDTVLIMGGSQGARGLNDAVMRGFPAWADAAGRVQFLHLAGALDAERVGRAYGECGLKARVMDFCDDMPAAYAASQVCVARSGASSLTELALCALPAVLVPLPTSAEDHQRRNADVYAAAGAALIAEQSACPGDELGRMVRGLLGDAERRGAMSAAMHALAAPDAAARVADVVEGRS